jgi:outer membrane receptor protein involved in Fe transport
LRAGMDLELGDWTGAASLMTFGRQRTLAITDGITRATLPGYTVVDLNLRRNRLTRRIDAFLRVENLFDARYFHNNERAFTNPEEIAGSPQAPRRISAGFDVRVGR